MKICECGHDFHDLWVFYTNINSGNFEGCGCKTDADLRKEFREVENAK